MADSVLKLLPKASASSLLFAWNAAFAIVPRQADWPFGLGVLRLDNQLELQAHTQRIRIKMQPNDTIPERMHTPGC